jgi:putative hemolysin
MTITVIIEFIALGLLLCSSAFFSSAETALLSLNPLQVHRLARTHPRAAKRIQRMLDLPQQLLSTVLIGNTLVNVGAAALGYAVAEALYPARGEVVAIPTMALLLLIFGEVAPKRLAMARSERLAVAYSRTLAVLVRVLTPLRRVLEGVTDVLEKYIRHRQDSLTEDEFLTVVEVGEEEGVLDEEERIMVDGIIRLEETQASEIMTPRVDLIGIDLDDPIEECRKIAESARYRYLPAYRESLDHIEGFLDVPRYLLSPEPDIEAAMIPPFVVPETGPLDTLLATFQREHRRVACVIDEYGGTAGLITRGDILEEIARDVDDEFGEAKTVFQEISPGRWLVEGTMSLEDINYEFDLTLEAEGADRIAGWVSAQAERVPRTGDVVEAQGCRATVQRVRKNRILLVLLEELAEEEARPMEEAT